MFSDKITQSIAEAAKKVMEEELKGDQHKIDANKNNKIDAHDFKLLRAKKKVEEEVEQIDEKKYEPAEYNAAAAAARKKREENEERRREARENGEDKPTVRKVAGKAYGGAAQKDDEDMNEEFEQIEERVQGGSDPLQNRQDYAKKHGTGQVYKKTYPGDKKGMTGSYAYDIKRSGPKGKLPEGTVSFSDLIESYKEGGIKSLFKKIEEEVDNETFTKEFKDQKDKFDGKKKGADVAAAATQGTKDMKEEVELTLEDYSLEEIEQYMMSEEYEQLDELDKSTLKSYFQKSQNSSQNILKKAQDPKNSSDDAQTELKRKFTKRLTGMARAVQKFNKEEVEDLEEKTLTSGETAEKERIVKSMKKNLPSFKERYGERAKSVMYATATKIAKEKE